MDSSQIDAKIDRDIRRVGWAVIAVFADTQAMQPGFSYTVGFEETLDFPEVIVFGLPPEHAQTILNTLGERIKKGRTPPFGKRLSELAEGHELLLQEIGTAAAAEYMFQAAARYDGWNFRAAQLIWPDPRNRMPWEPGYDNRFRTAQPLLYERVARA